MLKDATHQEIRKDIVDNKEEICVVNFWATWCSPCVKEMPDFVKIRRAYKQKGVEVLFVATDFPERRDEAKAMLKKFGVTWTSYFRKGKDEPFIRAFSDKWTGALPATAIFKNGKRVDFWEGKISHKDLEAKIVQLLRKP